MIRDDPFSTYLTRWDLVPDGEPIVTPTSRLQPVRHRGQPAMLKVTTEDEEHWGVGLVAWWGDIVSLAEHLDRGRLLRWVLALCGLSAVWSLEDGLDPAADLAIAELALIELRR